MGATQEPCSSSNTMVAPVIPLIPRVVLYISWTAALTNSITRCDAWSQTRLCSLIFKRSKKACSSTRIKAWKTSLPLTNHTAQSVESVDPQLKELLPEKCPPQNDQIGTTRSSVVPQSPSDSKSLTLATMPGQASKQLVQHIVLG